MSKSKNFLLALADFLECTSLSLEAFLFSAGSAKLLQKNLKMNNLEYNSVFQGLRRHGYIVRANEDQFLITPKAIKKIKQIRFDQDEWDRMTWDQTWKIISFDIPEGKRKERNYFRSAIKRKGFIGIQHSVFIAPFANFEILDELRRELKIEKYVSFFTAKTYQTDDDSALKKKFNL